MTASRLYMSTVALMDPASSSCTEALNKENAKDQDEFVTSLSDRDEFMTSLPDQDELVTSSTDEDEFIA